MSFDHCLYSDSQSPNKIETVLLPSESSFMGPFIQSPSPHQTQAFITLVSPAFGFHRNRITEYHRGFFGEGLFLSNPFLKKL